MLLKTWTLLSAVPPALKMLLESKEFTFSYFTFFSVQLC